MAVELKRCPCGEIPSTVCIIESNNSKYMHVVGGCCGEWLIEFRANYHPAGTAECKALAVEAWNNAPRGNISTPHEDLLIAQLKRLRQSLEPTYVLSPEGRTELIRINNAIDGKLE